MSNLLFDNYPLLVDRSLAEMIGLEKAVIVQQIHYWLQKKNNFHDGRYWVYNSIGKWREEQFRFIKSKNTLSKYLKELENDGILITGNYNKMKFDRTKWYTIDYDVLKARHYAFTKKGEMEVAEIGTRNSHNLGDGSDTNWVHNTKDYTKTTAKITKEDTSSKLDEPNSKTSQLKEDFDKLWKLYPNKKGKAKAFTAYKRAIKKGVTNKEIQDGIVAYKRNVKWQREHGFKDLEFAHGATWFNQQRWEDDYSLESKATYSYQQVDPYSQYT
ncbi:hypothetical protein [Ligilactobacillus equi]|uniref:Replication protein n=1 Tax=Ligilactobacillus equi DPC 6820 TaxID=1392007 RepID=V7HUA6_9LACO|nr:hypothetical protein [Ligilactobacillus equi]ETA73482.1 hypothetical protein LEQ_1854 [Ligilactobacillus equi DPC 6820]